MFADYRANGLIPPADVAAQYAEANSDSSALVAGKVAITFIAASQLTLTRKRVCRKAGFALVGHSLEAVSD
jgi:hypothetical protein